ncbi:M23 family peptidase, partial [Nocardiopsis sp. MG754419]|nr:M23 family peptidase [Nocardiopsis sp. MG754419]
MTDPRLWALSLILTLLLFPLLTPRTALAAPAPEGRWRWPVDPPVQVLRGFEPPAQRWSPGHRGVDLAAEPGHSVYPAGPGRRRGRRRGGR